MHNSRLTELPGNVRKSVLTSLSLLVSSNCAFANTGGWVMPSAPVQSTGHLSGSHLFNGNLTAGQPHQAAVSGQKHGAVHVLPALSSGLTHLPNLFNGNFLPPTNVMSGSSGQATQLDLSSTTSNVSLGANLFHGTQSVTINVGGQNVTLKAGALVTAAEYVAVKEVLANGSQTIQLSSSGNAIGGSFSINQVDSPKLSLLVVPQSVTGIDYLSSKSPLTINGDLINYGSIYDVSTRASITSGTIIAQDITNESGATISTVLPSALSSSISHAITGTSLNLNASGDINNSGTISSAGSLNLSTASGAINNNAGALISAVKNVNLETGSGTLSNAGLVASNKGNINIGSATASNDIDINATNGTFQATAGAINVRESSYAGAGNINVSSGNFQSQSFNLYSGTGSITGSVGQVTGTLNTSGDAAHFSADTANLVLGNNTIKGDPTYANTGGITISGAVSAQEDLTIVAGGNVNSTSGASLSTANVQGVNNNNPATDITVIAGATVTTTGSQAATLPGDSPIGAGNTATVNFSSGAGGSINLGNATIDSSSTATLTNSNSGYNQPSGGNVLLVAYANGSTGGTVTTGTITTFSQNANGGNVTIIAGANPTVAGTTTVNVGDIFTGGTGGSNYGFSSGGNVSVYTQQPGLSSGTTVTYNSDGSAATNARVIPTGAVASNAVVQLSNVVTGGNTVASAGSSELSGSIKVVAGGGVNVSGVLDTEAIHTGNITINSSGPVNIGTVNASASNSNSVSIDGNIAITGSNIKTGDVSSSFGSMVSVNGGNIYINGTGNVQTGTLNAQGSQGQTSGDVTVGSGGALTITGDTASGAVLGQNIVLGGVGGVAITAPNATKTVDIVSSGSVLITAGSSQSAATVSVAGGITESNAHPGFVEIVNDSATTGNVNLTVGGTITTTSSAENGQAGSVAIVSSGAIKLGNIAATELSTFNTGAIGGSVFISSGGTGTNAITVGTISTAVPKTGENIAGDVILIAPGATKTALNPANIKHGTITLTGAQAGTSLDAGLHITSDTIPTQINISETITGTDAINIKPGGYQTAQDLSTSGLTINNSNAAMVVPINVASSLILGTLAQATGSESINFVTGGSITFTANLQTSQNTSNIVIASASNINTTGAPALHLSSANEAFLFAPAGLTLATTSVSTVYDIVVGGTINTSSQSGSGSSVTLSSTTGNITTSDINTSGTGVAATAGGVTLSALDNITTGTINASTYNLAGGFNTSGAGMITISTSGNITTGDVINSGSGLVFLTSTGFETVINTGNILSNYTTTTPYTSLLIANNGLVRTGDITTASPTGNSGSVTISSGFFGTVTGTIDTSSSGYNGGSVALSGGGANAYINIEAINTSTTGTTQSGGGGSVIIVNTGGNIVWGTGGINTTASYSSTGTGNGGTVLISASGNSDGQIFGASINTSANSKNGDGGSVSVTGVGSMLGNINTSAYGPSATSGTGGSVTLGMSNGDVDTGSVTTKGVSQGGSIFETSGNIGNILNSGGVDASSAGTGGSLVAISGHFFYSPNITTSAHASGAGNTTGGSVEIVTLGSNIYITNTVDTSATSVGGSAQAGSVGISVSPSEFAAVTIGGINASAIASAGVGQSIAGDIFISSAGNIGSPTANPMTLNTSTTGGASSSVGQIYLGVPSVSVPVNVATSGNSASPILFYAGSLNPNITSDTTISVNTTTVNIYPGGYSGIGINSTPSPVNLTLDFGGDSRLLVPLVSTDGIYVSSVTANNTVGGSTFAYQKNGYNIQLIDSGMSNSSTGINDFIISGNITSAPASGGTQGNVQLAEQIGSLSQAGGTISGNSLTLSSFFDVGAYYDQGTHTPNPIVTNANQVTAYGFAASNGAVNVYITDTASGTVTLTGANQATGSGAVFSFTATDPSGSFTLPANAGITAPVVVLSTAGTNTAINLNGPVVGNSADANVSITSPVVNIGTTGFVSTDQMLIESSHVTNNGSLNTSTGTLAIDNNNAASPNLTISGTGSYFSSTALSLTAVGNVDFGGLISNGVLNIVPGSNLLIIAGGNITATGGNSDFSINTSSALAGGSVSMLAGVHYNLPFPGTFNDIEADTSPTATGGSILLNGPGYILSNINTTSSAGAGGSVLMIAQGPSTTSNVIALPTNGSITTGGLTKNGNVTLFATGPVGNGAAIQVGDINIGGTGKAVGGSIDIEGAAIGSYTAIFHNGTTSNTVGISAGGTGTVTTGNLSTNSGIVHVGAQGDITVHFTSSATLNANDFEVYSQSGTINLPVSTITVVPDPAGTGDGGTISLAGANITWPTQGTAPLILQANALAGSTGYGGEIDVEYSSATQVNIGTAPGNISMSAVGPQGGNLYVQTLGPVVVDKTAFLATPTGANGGGAYLGLSGSTVSALGGGPLVLSANGVGNADGGEIEIFQSTTGPVSVNSSTFLLSATSGATGGKGGTIQITAGGSLTVDPTVLKVNPLKSGDGGTLSLEAGSSGSGAAGTGDLQITSIINLAAKGTGEGGSLYLESNDNTNPFTIISKVTAANPTPLNGIVGIPVLTGKPNGQLTVINDAGGVTNLTPLTAYGGLDLESGGTGDLKIGASIGSTATQLTLFATGSGNIYTTSAANAITAGYLNISAKSGNIYGITTTTPLTISAVQLSANGADVNLLDKSAVYLYSSQATNSFSLSDTKNIISSNTITAPSLTLISSGFVAGDSKGLSALPIDTANLTVSGAGTFNLSNNNAGALTINAQTVKSKSFILTADSDINVAGSIGATTGIVSLTTTASNNINTTASGLINAKTLNLTVEGGDTGAIGSTGALQVNATTTSAVSDTSININETAATVTLGNLTANNGNIDITTSATTTKILQTLAIVGKVEGADITANNGSITLQNADATKGSIVIGKGSQIATEGTGGAVSIFIGASANGVIGTAPTGVLYNVNGSQVTPPNASFVFNNGITVAGTTATKPTIVMNSLGGGVITFDTGTLKPTAIKINGNTTTSPTTITADPPIISPLSSLGTVVGSTSNGPAVVCTANLTAAVPANDGSKTAAEIPLSTISAAAGQSAATIDNAIPSSMTLSSASTLSNTGSPVAAITSPQLQPTMSGLFSGITANSVASQSSPISRNTATGDHHNTSNLLDADWASETELTTGAIPAAVYSEQDMGLHSAVSTIVDMQTLEENGTGQQPEGSTARRAIASSSSSAAGYTLTGEITKTTSCAANTKGHENRRLQLNKGTVVFAPTVDTVVETALGKVSIAAKSLVMLTAFRDGLAVYDLDDSHQNAVTVSHGNTQMVLSPGRHALLTNQTEATFADVNPAQMIGYRNIKERAAAEGIKVFTSDFSLAQAVSVVQPVKQMFNSEHPHARKVSSHLLKTISIMMAIDSNGGQYQQVLRPRLTAYAQK